MSALMLFAQALDVSPAAPVLDITPSEWIQWLYVWGEPSVTLGRWWGGFVSWSKVVGIYCALAWAVGWLISGSRSNTPGAKSSPIKLGVVIAILVTMLLAALLGTLEETGRTKFEAIGGMKPGTWVGLLCVGLIVGLSEYQLWTAMWRSKAKADIVCLVAMHVAVALGFFVGFRWNVFNEQYMAMLRKANVPVSDSSIPDWRSLGVRIGAAYVGLVALVRVGFMLIEEVAAIRIRRIYSIAWQSVAEATRSNRAPYVVVSMFVVVLAFTHWFLRSGEGDAELSRGFVQTLTFLCSILLLMMIVFVAPLSMPRDISNQTIYTIVSKPVRRIELIWGRLVGYMAMVTVLLTIFGLVGLVYLQRNVGSRIGELREEGRKFAAAKPLYSKQKFDAADQLERRMSARIPLKGALIFQDSKKKEHQRGIDVGQEQDMRSFVEGATESRAVWKFEEVPDQFAPGGTRDLRIPIETLLLAGTIEAIEDRLYTLGDEQQLADQEKKKGKLSASDVARYTNESAAKADEIARLAKERQALLAQEQEIQGRLRKAARQDRQPIRDELAKLHSPNVTVEMTFTIYRTTKGIVGEPVLANLRASNPRPGSESFSTMIPIHEYYTNRTSLPAKVLVGSRGRVKLEVRCVTANQYLGMSEGDLYVLADTGGFRLNFLKGLFGIWLQVLVLTAIGLFAGTFLSWPVAILTTLFFFLFGQIAFSYLAELSIRALDQSANGPFESFIRILNHQNMQAALAPTAAVVAAKTADSIVLPLMATLAYLIPNFGALDVSNTVAEGFAVTWTQIRDLTMMGFGYALPFSVAGYFSLKNREVAA